MKRLSWLLLLAFFLSVSIGLAAPTWTPATTSQIVSQGSAVTIDLASSDYIGNSASGIFHYANCRYVSRMSENHKVYFDTRDEAIDAGYRPCKVCRP
jgi:Adenosine deaminase